MKISVVIPTYNRASIIRESIVSVINQTYDIDEIIVVDDCGNDNTKEMISSINDTRIQYIKLPENKGQSFARNYGVSIAKNPWIAFQDSDTLWHTDKIQKQVDYINQHDGCQVVYSAYQRDDNGLILPTCFNLNQYEGNILSTLLIRNTVDAPTILITKSLFEKTGGFDEYMRSLEDWDLAIRIAQIEPLGFINIPLLTSYRIDNSISVNFAAHYQYTSYIIAKHLSIYQQYDLFNTIVADNYNKAKQYNLEEQFEKMLSLYLTHR